jgi:hypothetical protein
MYSFDWNSWTKSITLPDGDVLTWRIIGYWYVSGLNPTYVDMPTFTIYAKYPEWDKWHWSDVSVIFTSVKYPEKVYKSLNMNLASFTTNSNQFVFVGSFKKIDEAWIPADYYTWHGIPLTIKGNVILTGNLTLKP